MKRSGILLRFHDLGRGTLTRRVLVLGGLAAVALAIITSPPATVPVNEKHLTSVVSGAGLASIGFGLAWHVKRSQRIPWFARLVAVIILVLLSAILAISAIVYL